MQKILLARCFLCSCHNDRACTSQLIFLSPGFSLFYVFDKIGATPTVENCRIVLKEMPLKSCNVSAAWRSRGCLADAIVIQPNGVTMGGSVCGKIGEAPPSPVASCTAAGQVILTIACDHRGHDFEDCVLSFHFLSVLYKAQRTPSQTTGVASGLKEAST